MSRLSQFFWALNAEHFPNGRERRFYFTAIDLEGEGGRYVKRLRRQLKLVDPRSSHGFWVGRIERVEEKQK